MQACLLSGGMLFLHFFATSALAETESARSEKKYIPLNEVWAYEMPGTKDVRELEPDKFGPILKTLSTADQIRKMESSTLGAILKQIQSTKPVRNASNGFIVAGTGTEALKATYAVLVGDKKASQSFPPNTKLSIVFFSHLFGQYVHIQRVQQRDNLFEVGYYFEPHLTKEMTFHFALIPIGDLAPGSYEVKCARLMPKKYGTDGIKAPSVDEERKVVAQSFQFEIKKP